MDEDVFEGELWVRGHDGERGILHGNPHTHPGRFSVLWESTGETHATSLSDLADVSDQSRAWLAGFLSGNEPEPFQVLGLDIDDDVTDEQYEVWREKLAEFRESGWMWLPIPDEIDVAGEHGRGVDQAWYAVRCLIRLEANSDGDGGLYEERVTLWRASSFTEAVSRAEQEAAEYAAGLEGESVGLAQAYHLFDEPGEGAEVFSLMRSSQLDPDVYVSRFFAAGDENQTIDDAP